MFLPKSVFDFGFVSYILHNGGNIYSLDINLDDFGLKGWNCMNPSILFFKDKLYFSVRCVNYTLFNSVLFPVRSQPTIYCENEGKLRSVNFVGILNENDFSIESIGIVDTSKLDTKPLWNFIGLEDARLVSWNGRLSLCGVRRDFKKDGTGRMELSTIEKDDDKWNEISRERIEIPDHDDNYCEKNWMPFLDKPGIFLRNISADELINMNRNIKNICNHIVLPSGLRGDSQIVRYSNDGYIGLIHECQLNLLDKSTNARTGKYLHHFIILDNDGKIIGITKSFQYSNDFNIEFGCGLAIKGDNVYVSFSEMDLAAFLLVFDKKLIGL